jgi:hypothetical protein
VLLVEALTERFQHVGQPVMVLPGDMPPEMSERQIKFFAEPGRYEGHLGVTIRNIEVFNSPEPNVVFSHADALGMAKLGVKKRMGHPRLDFLDPWGSAADVMAAYFGEAEMDRQRSHEKWVNA